MGRLAEESAARCYIEKGYLEIAKNIRFGRIGEIDRIFSRQLPDCVREVVFCVVKCRRDITFAAPSLAVNYKKQARIRKMAQIFLYRHPEYRKAQPRFDVAEVLYRDSNFYVNILENAF